MHGMKDGHCNGQYASYWNAFLSTNTSAWCELTLASKVFSQTTRKCQYCHSCLYCVKTKNPVIQECIPVGCVPPAHWPWGGCTCPEGYLPRGVYLPRGCTCGGEGHLPGTHLAGQNDTGAKMLPPVGKKPNTILSGLTWHVLLRRSLNFCSCTTWFLDLEELRGFSYNQ